MPPSAMRIEGYKSGTAQERTTALMDLFKDKTIQGIICSIGGFNSNEIVPLLDYQVIAKNPKIFVGYSDATALLLALYAGAGLVTLHGPALLPEWGEYPMPFDYTVQSFLAVAASTRTDWCYEPPAEWTNESLDWGKDCRLCKLVPHQGWHVIREGHVEGKLVGGNIETLNALIGSPYCPSFARTILFIEATREEAFLPRFERALTHLELAGVFRDVRALVVARCPDARLERGVHFHTICRRLGDFYDIPVAGNLDFGHTEPKMTLPVGVRTEVLCRGDSVTLRLMEPAVCESG